MSHLVFFSVTLTFSCASYVVPLIVLERMRDRTDTERKAAYLVMVIIIMFGALGAAYLAGRMGYANAR